MYSSVSGLETVSRVALVGDFSSLDSKGLSSPTADLPVSILLAVTTRTLDKVEQGTAR